MLVIVLSKLIPELVEFILMRLPLNGSQVPKVVPAAEL
jgi:hypothetical protein